MGPAVGERNWFARDALEVARGLLGARLISTVDAQPVELVLTEVEAYRGEQDPGSHAFRGRTARTEVMFGPAAHLYVYFSYGMHWCVNVVCGEVGAASAVLLRAGEVVAGLQTARERRPTAKVDRDLARGPARLATALGITGALDGMDLLATDAPVRLVPPESPVAPSKINCGPRVGVSGPGGDGEQFPWRFWIADEPSVSVYRPGVSRNRPRPGTL